MRGITALLLALTAAIGPVSAADKTHPEFLREQHAGSKTFVSAQPAATLFPDLLQATAACYLGDVEPGAGMANRGGAIGSLQSASREVTGELSADGRSAYIVVRAKGFFGAVQTNFLQIDIQEAAGTTNVTAFHKNNVKAQRQFLGEVERWLNGEPGFCYPQPFMVKKKD